LHNADFELLIRIKKGYITTYKTDRSVGRRTKVGALGDIERVSWNQAESVCAESDRCRESFSFLWLNKENRVLILLMPTPTELDMTSGGFSLNTQI
jgi:hypothetical protein